VIVLRGLVVLAVLAAAATLIGGSQASFNAKGVNPNNVFATTALYAPSGLTATTSGHNVNLSWSAGTNGNGYAIRGVANGTSSNCSSVTYGSVGTSSGTSYTDSGRYTPQGTWFCYQVATSYASWTSVNSNPGAAAQIGVVATSVVAGNGGTSGRLDSGDTITVTFNQAITTGSGPSGTDTVCSVNGATIMVGSNTTSGACGPGEAVDLGKLTGGTTSARGRWNATYAWSSGNTRLTITLGTRTNGAGNVNASGTWTLNPTTTATKLLSATGSFHACDTNTGGGNCLPTMTGSF
jgi:hypothetical protein